MFGTGLIVFRETLEAALFVGIVAASTRGLMNRSRWLALGVGAGALGSLLLATGMERIAAWAQGVGQELVTAAILILALAMLAWHCVWVSPNAKAMAQDAKRLGAEASRGAATLWALAIAVALSVLREGAETVLFVAGLLSGQSQSLGASLLSAAAGLSLGVAVGWLLYVGLGKFSPHRLFAITNALILMLAGSLASQLAKTLNQADWLSTLDQRAWDTSALISNDSAAGVLLQGTIGYDASPTQLQFLFYLCTVVLIAFAAKQVKTRKAARRPNTP